MCGIPAGNYVYWSRWSRLHHDQNNGYQHTPIPTHGGHKNPPWHETCAWGMRERTREGIVVYQRTDKQIWNSRLLTPPPSHPVGLQHGQSHVEVWRKQIWPLTLEFGCKTEYKTVGPDVFGQHPLWKGILCLSPRLCPQRRSEDVGGLPHGAGCSTLKEAHNEASIPLKCTDNWNLMGCSRGACCDGWVVGPLLPGQRNHKLRGKRVFPAAHWLWPFLDFLASVLVAFCYNIVWQWKHTME